MKTQVFPEFIRQRIGNLMTSQFETGCNTCHCGTREAQCVHLSDYGNVSKNIRNSFSRTTPVQNPLLCVPRQQSLNCGALFTNASIVAVLRRSIYKCRRGYLQRPPILMKLSRYISRIRRALSLSTLSVSHSCFSMSHSPFSVQFFICMSSTRDCASSRCFLS